MAMGKGQDDAKGTTPDAPVQEPAAPEEVRVEVDGVVVSTNRADVPVATSLATGPGEHKPAVPVDEEGQPVE